MIKFGRLIKAEFAKYLLEAKCYYPDHIVSVIVLFIMFAGVFAILPDSGFFKSSSYYIGFVYWYFADGIMACSSMAISDEKQSGTLEQLLIKPVNFSSILFIRSIGWLIFQAVEVTVVMAAIGLILNIPMHFSIAILPVFLITMLGLVGISYMLSALTLIFTKTASFITIFGYALLFFTGAISNAAVVKNAAYYILPLSQGIAISRQMLDANMAVSSLDMALLSANSLGYLVIGVTLFLIVLRYGRKNGFSSKY